ncbi:MAG: hypothetical protein ACFE8J_18090 [Candidatus Heimdallarchaeota archaeon]
MSYFSRKRFCVWTLTLLIGMLLSAFTLPRSISASSLNTFNITSSSIYSKHVDDTYNIMFAIPNDYNETAPYNYPTIYLLDA